MNVTHLECASCKKKHEAQALQNLCKECGKLLLVRYNLEKAAQTLVKVYSQHPKARLVCPLYGN